MRTVATGPFTRQQRMTLLATSLGLFMIFLDATIVNVALPDIQRDFGGGEQALQWVVAAYSLTMGMFIMSAATLADQRGRRRVFLIGTALFALASAVCGAAPNLVVLNLGRAVQGVGAATVNVASLALVSAAFPEPRSKARAIGIWTAIASVGLAIGPTVGGVLTETIGWRSIFFINLAIGALAAMLVRSNVAESRATATHGFDLPGQVLFIAAVGAVIYGLIEGPHRGWDDPLILGLFVGAVAVAVAFVIIELRVADPMMDVRLFGDRVYTAAIGTLFTVLFGVYGLMLVITQYLQNVRDESPVQAGLVMLGNTVPAIVFAPIAGAWAAKRGGRRPILIGVACMVISLATIAVGVGGPLLVIVVGLAFSGVGSGLAISPTTNVAMSSVPVDRAGMASGIMSAQRALGSAAGFAVMGSVLAAVVGLSLPDRFAPYLAEPGRQEAVDIVVEDANPRAVVSIIGPAKPLPDAVASTAELVEAADDAFAEGIRAALIVGAALNLLALVWGLLVFPGSARGGAMVSDEEAEARHLAALEAAGG